MSCYLFQLDLSKDNESDILFQFHDTQTKTLISHMFEKFDVQTEQTQNEAAHYEPKLHRVYFKRHGLDEEFRADDAKGKKLELC